MKIPIVCFVTFFVFCFVAPAWSEEELTPLAVDKLAKEPLQPQLLQYRSKLYGDVQQFGFSATDFDKTPKPLIVDLIPGSFSRGARIAKDCAYMCEVAQENGLACVAVRPCGRGDGSVYQGFGEIDVYEVIDAVKQVIAIDSDRITLTGVSMGGAATWYHASHYPDVWAAAAPFCGYCDYQLWKKPGGTTFHRAPWEDYSWQSRGAAYRPGNLRHVLTRITHGEWDRAVGGGVPVEHSRAMDRKLTQLNIPHEYHELPKTGHRSRNRENWRDTLLWLLKQERVQNPDHISLTVHTLRHNRSRWVTLEQQHRSGQVSHVDAQYDRQKNVINVSCENVSRLQFGPLPDADAVDILIDEQKLPLVDLTNPVTLETNASGTWKLAKTPIPSGQKRPGLSGPFGDIFLGPVVIVYGTSGTDEATHLNRTLANDQVRFFSEHNGGVHRGGIKGENSVPIPVISDREFTEITQGKSTAIEGAGEIQIDAALLQRANLYLIGNFTSNAALAKLKNALPVTISSGSLTLAGKSYTGENLGFFGVFPHPDGRRYVALLAGQVPDAICWGSHVGLQLLPDFLIFERERIVDFGFWDNQWRYVEEG